MGAAKTVGPDGSVTDGGSCGLTGYSIVSADDLLTEEWLPRWRLVEAKLSVSEVLSIVVRGVVGAPEVQFVGHVVVPAVRVLRRRNVAGQSVHEDEEPACRTALGTRVVGGTVFATRSAACVEHEVVRDRASHLLQKQTTSDPYELAQAVKTPVVGSRNPETGGGPAVA